jgi:hypothetical protein
VSPLFFLFIISHTYLTHLHNHQESLDHFQGWQNHNGWFDMDDLLKQVDKAIDIFKGLTKGWAQGLFLFDNAPSHQKHAADAISARNMVKGVLTFPVSHHHHCHCLQRSRLRPPKANEGGTWMSPHCTSGRRSASASGAIPLDA